MSNYPVKILERKSKKHDLTYTWYFYYYDAKGRHMKSKSGYLSYEEAFNDGLIAYKEYSEKGIVPSRENDKKSLDDIFNLMLKDYNHQSNATKRDTNNRYNKYIKPLLGNRFIKTIKLNELQEVVNDWNKNTYSSVYEHNCSLLRKLFITARRHGYISENPCELLVYPKGRKKTLRKTKMPENEDLKLFRNYMLSKVNECGKDKRYKVSMYEIQGHLLAFDIGLVTGARIGEVYALDWNNINFEEMKFEFRQSYDYMSKVMNTEMKNQYSRRDYPFDQDMKNKLLEWKSMTVDFFGYLPSSLLTREDKDRLDPRAMQDYMKKFNKKYDKSLSFHQLRHYFATVNRYENNADLAMLQKLIGHAVGSDVTDSVYAHLSDQKKRELLEKYNEHIKPLLN